MDKKKCFGALSSAVLGAVLTFGLTTNAHAAVKSYVVDDNDQIISFNLSNLLSDYTNNLLGEASPMYDKYLKEASNLVAFEDDKKGFVSYDSVIAAYENALSQNNGSEFNVDNFTENASSADIKDITVGYECNQDGSVVQISAGTMPTATIEKAGTDIVGKTVVIASLPQGIDASKYDVTVNGTKLTYNASTGKFTGTVDGTYTTEELQNNTTVSNTSDNTSDGFDVDSIY